MFVLLAAVPTGPDAASPENVVFEMASAQGNVGRSTGITGPDMPTVAKVTFPFNMWTERLATNVEFAIADTDISYYGLTGDREAEAAAKQRTVDLLRDHRFDGVVLQSYWTVDRCIDIDVPENARWMRDLYRDEW